MQQQWSTTYSRHKEIKHQQRKLECDHQNPLHAEMCLQIGSDGKKEKKKGQREGQEEKEGSGRERKLGAKTFVVVPLAEGGDSKLSSLSRCLQCPKH